MCVFFYILYTENQKYGINLQNEDIFVKGVWYGGQVWGV